MNNPFIYGRPVRGTEFMYRKQELSTVFNRLFQGESTAITGEPHIGKTSFLLRLTDADVQKEYLGEDVRQIITSYVDLYSIPSNYAPFDFWDDVLQPLVKHPRNHVISECLSTAKKGKYDRRDLQRLFKSLSNQNRLLVILLDEFQRLLYSPNFRDPAFFGLLRSLSTSVGGLSEVIASRMTIVDLHKKGREILGSGSPFFNNMVNVHLMPFDDEAISSLLEKAGIAFSPLEKIFIRRIAGRNPFLLQAMSASLIEAPQTAERLEIASENFYARIRFHFENLWDNLDDDSRTVALILSVKDLDGRILGSDFNYGEIERIDLYGPELRLLASRGLAECVETSEDNWIVDRRHLLVWRGERWMIGAEAFAWWVRDAIVAPSRGIPLFTDWLNNQRYQGLLTQKQLTGLQKVVERMPSWALRGVGGLARTLWDEIVKGKK